MPSREDALRLASEHVGSGAFATALARRVAFRTESPVPSSVPQQRAYLTEEITPFMRSLGFETRLLERETGRYFLLASRRENDALPTVLLYGHGDTVPGMEGRWTGNRDPWRLTPDGDRLFGRGTADNKGQHSANLSALEIVLRCRGKLGFNACLLLEMGEELGSPGLRDVCRQERDSLAADVLIASDGPRLAADRPTLFLGSRGAVRFRLSLTLREGAHHSGNWGGLLSNPATILSHAIASMIDRRGTLLVPGLRPVDLPDEVREALVGIVPAGAAGEPAVEPDWGEPGLSPAERVFAWNTLEVIGLGAGSVIQPVSAIPGRAEALLQLRFVVGLDWREVVPTVQAFLDSNGFGAIKAELIDGGNATRTLAENPWVRDALHSIRRTTGKDPALLPNFGGTLPNDVFVEELDLPTLWIPHSYPGCNQHAPDEHNLLPLLDEAVRLMTGLFWDIGEAPPGR